jgi:hypothetical protein
MYSPRGVGVIWYMYVGDSDTLFLHHCTTDLKLQIFFHKRNNRECDTGYLTGLPDSDVHFHVCEGPDE